MTVPRIVVLDGHTLNPGDNPWSDLEDLGEVAVFERTPVDRIAERAAEAAIVLTNKTPLDAAAMKSLPALRMISVLATGFDVVDVAAAAERGVVVANVPEYGTDSVAQHVFALLLELCSAVGAHDRAVRDGAWQRSPDFSFWLQSPIELSGRTMGVVGCGRIGRRVAAIASAFGMRVLVTSRNRCEIAGAEWTDHAKLVAEADVISLHCPLTQTTRGMVDAAFLRRMRPNSFLINTARGPLVDEDALAAALRDGSIAGAAVDVVAAEPIRADNPLLRAPRCIITPHLAWASLAARRRLMAATVQNVRAFLAGAPINVVGAGQPAPS